MTISPTRTHSNVFAAFFHKFLCTVMKKNSAMNNHLSHYDNAPGRRKVFKSVFNNTGLKSIPPYAIGERRALVILKIGEQRGVDRNMEIIRFVRTYRHKARGHREAVEITGNIAIHISELVSVEIVARRETEVPLQSEEHTSELQSPS